MNGTCASQRIRARIYRTGVAVGLAMTPLLAWAETVATTASQASVYSRVAPVAPDYYGQGMMGAWGPGPYGPAMMMDGWGPVAMLIYGLIWILVIVGIIGGILFLARRHCTAGRGRCGGRSRYGSIDVADKNTALTILSERYARGEIEQDEYLEKRKDLER